MTDTNTKTPASCVADFCLIPIGTPTASVSHQIADVQRLLKKSELKYEMHSAGTTVEGHWDEVMQVIGEAHTMLHGKGILRIQTDIRVGSRIDKKQSFPEKLFDTKKKWPFTLSNAVQVESKRHWIPYNAHSHPFKFFPERQRKIFIDAEVPIFKESSRRNADDHDAKFPVQMPKKSPQIKRV